MLALAFTGPGRAQSFKDALGQAYLYNPQLAAGRAGLRQRDEGVPRALSGWRPSVTVLGEVGKSIVSDSLVKHNPEYRTPQAALLAVQQPLYSGGRVSAQLGQAKALVLAQRAQLRNTATVLFAAGTAYLDVARDQRVVGLNRTNLMLLDRTLHAAEQQYAVGDITLADVAQARARRRRPRPARYGRVAARRVARHLPAAGRLAARQPRHAAPGPEAAAQPRSRGGAGDRGQLRRPRGAGDLRRQRSRR